MTKIFIWLLSTVLVTTVSTTEAQQRARPTLIGYLSSSSVGGSEREEAFRQGLRDLGYIEGQNIIVEGRFADRADQLSALAAELVGLKVDVIVTAGTNATHAAKGITKTIPIVMDGTGDPVSSGLVASLARPGGNITGLSATSAELSGKRVELLKEIFPRITRVAVIGYADNRASAIALKESEVAAQALALQLQALQFRNLEEIDQAFSVTSRAKADALIILRGLLGNPKIRGRILELAAKNRLPAMYPTIEMAEAGGLMAYGISNRDLARRATVVCRQNTQGDEAWRSASRAADEV
jgi:putative ABC transport system substrate-binding protein